MLQHKNLLNIIIIINREQKRKLNYLYSPNFEIENTHHYFIIIK